MKLYLVSLNFSDEPSENREIFSSLDKAKDYIDKETANINYKWTNSRMKTFMDDSGEFMAIEIFELDEREIYCDE
jgi:hypothetical protein